MSNPINPTAAGAQLAASQAQQSQTVDQARALQRRLEGTAGDERKLKQACQDFEAIFLSKIWQQMRNTVPKEGYLHSKQEDFYMSMFDHELSRKMSRSGGIGLTKMLYTQLKEQLAAQAKKTGGAAPETVPVNAAGQPVSPGIPLAPKAPVAPVVEPPAPLANGDQRALGNIQNAAQAANAAGSGAVQSFRPAAAGIPAAGKGGAAVAAPSSGSAPVDADVSRRIDELARQILSQGGIQEKSGSGRIPLSSISWPLAGRIVAGFGQQQGGASDTAVHIQGRAGAPVRACLSGVVTFAGLRHGRQVVELAHAGGLTSRYSGLGDLNVQAGHHVSAGREIATLPPSTGPQEGNAAPRMAFELHHGGVALNPELLKTV